jgi:hypothetical protein
MKFLSLFISVIICFNVFGQDDVKLIPFMEAMKWGVKNSSGKEVIHPQYDKVKIYDDGYILCELEKNIEIYDSSGIIVSKNKYKRVGPDNYKQKKLFTDNACQVCSDFYSGCGLIDKQGSLILPLEYYHMGDFYDNLTYIHKERKRGYVNTEGVIVIPIIYDWGTNNFQNGFVQIQLSEKEGFIDKTGKIVVPIEYIPNTFDYNSAFHSGVVAVSQNNKWGFVDTTGKVVIPLKYDFAWGVFDSLVAVQKNGKWGFIDLNNSVVIPIEYDSPFFPEFHEGIAAVEIKNRIGFINKENKKITEFKYYSLCPASYGLKMKNGVSARVRITVANYKFENGYATVQNKDCKMGLIDSNGNEIVPLEYNNVWLDKDGNIKVSDGTGIKIFKKGDLSK